MGPPWPAVDRDRNDQAQVPRHHQTHSLPSTTTTMPDPRPGYAGPSLRAGTRPLAPGPVSGVVGSSMSGGGGGLRGRETRRRRPLDEEVERGEVLYPTTPYNDDSRGRRVEQQHARHSSSSSSSPPNTSAGGYFLQAEGRDQDASPGINGHAARASGDESGQYYRRHVLQYDHLRPAQGHAYASSANNGAPSQQPPSAIAYEHSPGYPVASLPSSELGPPPPSTPLHHPQPHSQIVAGIPSHAQTCVNSFSSRQKQTPIS